MICIFFLNMGDLFPQNEEVQFLENELQSQKQKFSKLKSFTRSLLIAVKNKDRQKQRVRKHERMKLLDKQWRKSDGDRCVCLLSGAVSQSTSESE